MSVRVTEELSDRYASTAEATLAFAALTTADFARLGRIAQLRAHGVPGLTWEDLLNDAVEKLLSGVRRWPTEVPLLVFMREVMRSLASEAWRRHAQAGIVSSSAEPADDEKDPYLLVSDPTPGPERDAIARDLLNQVMELFADDAPVVSILRAMAEGSTADEIQRNLRMPPREYETCRRRLRRRLARQFPEGFAG